MVAAWMRADTGVGPAMASGSQTCSGNWALFPTAPMNSRMPPATATEDSAAAPSSAAARMSPMRKEPTATDSTKVPMMSPRSPTRLT